MKWSQLTPHRKPRGLITECEIGTVKRLEEMAVKIKFPQEVVAKLAWKAGMHLSISWAKEGANYKLLLSPQVDRGYYKLQKRGDTSVFMVIYKPATPILGKRHAQTVFHNVVPEGLILNVPFWAALGDGKLGVYG